MEEKVFQNLIALYQAKGISFEHLLANPVFQQLPIEAKIKLIKAHASELKDGVSSFSSDDVKHLLLALGFGAAAGAGFMKMVGAKTPIPIALFSAGSTAAATKAIMHIRNLSGGLSDRSVVRSLPDNPTEQEATAFLARLHGLKKVR